MSRLAPDLDFLAEPAQVMGPPNFCRLYHRKTEVLIEPKGASWRSSLQSLRDPALMPSNKARLQCAFQDYPQGLCLSASRKGSECGGAYMGGF